MNKEFSVFITKEAKWYVAHAVELGVVSQGKTIEEARSNIKEAVELYLEDMPKKSAKDFGKEVFLTTIAVKYA